MITSGMYANGQPKITLSIIIVSLVLLTRSRYSVILYIDMWSIEFIYQAHTPTRENRGIVQDPRTKVTWFIFMELFERAKHPYHIDSSIMEASGMKFK